MLSRAMLILNKSKKLLKTSFYQCINPSTDRYPMFAASRKHDMASYYQSINACCKAGKMEMARRLFDEMPNRNVVSFSMMIYGYSSNGLLSESFELFSRMQKVGICPNSFTFVAILVGAAGLQVLKLGESIHGGIVKGGLESDFYVITALLDAYAKCGSAVSSYRLFNQMEYPSIASCNAMVAGFTINHSFEEALLLFKRLWVYELVPNYITMLSVTQSCISYGSFELCETMHAYIVKFAFDMYIAVTNSVLDMYLSFEDLQIGRSIFYKITNKDVITWTTMMGFLLAIECATEAFCMFLQMIADGIVPDTVAMVNVITACANMGDFGKGRSAHSKIIVRGLRTEVSVINSLITMYSVCGDLKSAMILFDCIHHKSLVSWTSMISGFVQNGFPREGLRLLIRMRKEESLILDSILFISALTACAKLASFELCKQFHAHSVKSGLTRCNSVHNNLISAYGKCGHADLARKVFEEIGNQDLISWNAMLSSYGMNGQGQAAVCLFHEMEECGQKPDSITYLSLLAACDHSGLVDDGLAIFGKMIEDKRIKPVGEHFGCLVDMLARAGRLEDARKLVNSMPEKVGTHVWKAPQWKSYAQSSRTCRTCCKEGVSNRLKGCWPCCPTFECTCLCWAV